jgi:nitroreductase
MIHNAVIDAMINRKSIRKYQDQPVTDEVVETIVRAGMQAPFASQSYSVLLSRDRSRNTWNAPAEFVICVDVYKLALIMGKRNWKIIANDLSVLLFGIQDAVMMAENMVIAAESLGLGSCFLGAAPYHADRIAEQFHLPPRVFPIVGLVMGYPAGNPPPRPRYPLDFVLFEDRYPELTDDQVGRAMEQMDEGFLAQGYYRKAQLRLKLEDGRPETFTFDDYSWTEHISRKWGQWHQSPDELLEQLAKRGFRIPGLGDTEEE